MELISEFEIGLWNLWIFTIWLLLFPILAILLIKDKNTTKRLRTSATVKFDKFLNIITMFVIIFEFIYSIFIPIKFDNNWFYVGSLFFLMGFLLYITTILSLKNVPADNIFNKGSYRFSRHPFYLSMFIIFLSVFIISLSWIFLILLLALLIIFSIIVPAEEKFCLDKYGKRYQEYMRKTPRWIGMPKSNKKK